MQTLDDAERFGERQKIVFFFRMAVIQLFSSICIGDDSDAPSIITICMILYAPNCTFTEGFKSLRSMSV